MRVNVKAENVEVTGDGCMAESYQLAISQLGDRRYITIPRSWCTEIPDPIECGTMVLGWDCGDGAADLTRVYGRYMGPSYEQHQILDAAGRKHNRLHLRPLTAADLRGEG